MSYTAQPVAPSDTGDVDGGAANLAPARRDKTVISSPRLHRLQRRHFVLFDVLPFAGTLAAVALAFFVPLGAVDFVLFLVMWLLTGLGLTVGFHRLFSHRAFATSNAMAVAFVILGSMAARGPMFSWVAMHRRHHERADHDGDMHSPVMHGRTLSQRARGWVHAHLTWMIRHDYPNVAYYVPDLQRNDALVKANGHYHAWVALGLVLPTLIGAALTESWIGGLTAFLWGGAVRMFVVEQSMSAVNSLLHLSGSRPFDRLRDNSRNSILLGLLVWGEGWHNNHHAFPYSAAFGLRWHQIDPGFWLIRSLQAAGLAWDVKLPTAQRVASMQPRAPSPEGGM
jgi:stearoyl-CoA desaturase (Delta-9 desaturase)